MQPVESSPQQTEVVLAALREIHDALIHNRPHDAKHREELILTLEALLLATEYTPTEQEQILAIFADDLPVMHKHVFDYSVEIEKSFFEATRENERFDREVFARSPWYYNFLDLAQQEVALGGMRASDHVLFIGSGPFPMSAIIYVLESGCRVTCIEKVPQNAAVSRELIETLGLSDRISVINMLGEEFVDADYSLISLPSQALPKDKLMARIDEQVPSGRKIICRVRGGLGKVYYASELEPSVFERFSELDRAYMTNQVAIALLLEKK